jgi:uncharacterized protein (DUF1015 family)
MFMKPFCGYRPAPGLIAQVASPPYDVINTEEARTAAGDNAKSFLFVIKPEIHFPAGEAPGREALIAKARQHLDGLCDDATLQQEASPAYYIYQQTWRGHTQTGLLGLASVDEYDANQIKKHEHTRQDKEDERTAHVHGTRAHTGPVFLAYRGKSVISELTARVTQKDPDMHVTHQEVEHHLWLVKEPADCDAISAAVDDIDAFFVADGHHRSASASRNRALCRDQNPDHTGNESYNYFLTVIFPSEELQILPYHRVLKDLAGQSLQQIKDRILEKFDWVSNAAEPQEKLCFGLFVEGEWNQYRLKPELVEPNDPVKSLDVAMVQEHILQGIFGIDDPRTDDRIGFVGGIRGLPHLEELVASKKCAAAISMFPTHIDELFAVADVNQVMPPKSTWFEPKLLSGLVVNRF